MCKIEVFSLTHTVKGTRKPMKGSHMRAEISKRTARLAWSRAGLLSHKALTQVVKIYNKVKSFRRGGQKEGEGIVVAA